MLLDCVVTAVNENPLYLEFIPIFIETWKLLYPEVDAKIILIAEKIPDEYIHWEKHIILFEPIEGVSTVFTSQYIRLLYPCIMNYENGVLITDIDMLPMNRTYYTENIKSYDNTKFIYYGEPPRIDKQIFMCYNVAVPGVWRDIFGVHSVEDVREHLKRAQNRDVERGVREEIRKTHGVDAEWFNDQFTLYEKVMEWQAHTNNFVSLKKSDTGFRRLDRNTFHLNDPNLCRAIAHGVFSDYHCYRPMAKYREINNHIFKLLTFGGRPQNSTQGPN
jgi:hypothetical protein